MGCAAFYKGSGGAMRVKKLRHKSGEFTPARRVSYKTEQLYQNWNAYPNSPVVSGEYKYQIIYQLGSLDPIELFLATVPFDIHDSSLGTSDGSPTVKYSLNASVWEGSGSGGDGKIVSGYWTTLVSLIKESNHDIYYNSAVVFNKTVDMIIGGTVWNKVNL